MSEPWKKYQEPETVSEGGPWSKYGQMTPREAVDALPSFLTRTAEEKQADQARINAEQQAVFDELNEIPRGFYGPAWNDRARERDIILESKGKTMTGPEAAAVRFGNSALLTLPQHLSDEVNEAVGDAGNEYPLLSLAGDVAGFAGPGGLAYKGLEKGARAFGSRLTPFLRTPKGSTMLSRVGRYLPVIGSGTAASVGDYALYEGTVGSGTRAAQEGRLPTLDERLDAAKDAPTDPLAYIGGAASPIYRAGRGAVTTVKNTVDASKQAGRFTPKAGSFTPTSRAQWAATVMQPKTPQSEAYRMIAKRLNADGIEPEQLHKAIDNYYYAGYSTVDEMLFELAEAASNGKGGGQLKQLAVALGSVGGDAQTTARDAFRDRRLGSLTRLRDDLRSAAGLEGSDFYKYNDQLKAAERTLPDYGPAYSQSITDDSWAQTLWPQIQTSPSAREALDRAWKYASDRGDLEVAREIDTLIQGLGPNPARSGVSRGAAGNVPQKPSTQALDYIDRSLGGQAQSLRVRGDADIASGTQDAQAGLRSVVDAETGLDQPRRVVHELKTAQRALDFGRNAAANRMDLETIQREFAKEMNKFADEGVEVLGEETATINAALMMGWVRGAEDMISKASNPATAIRQLYGTPRQREKMVMMLQGLDESGLNLTSGKQADATKRLRQVTGDKYGAGETAQGRGRFDRERIMLDSENQIVGNSQTGQRNEAVAAQGGLEQKINIALDVIDAPRHLAKKAIRHGVNRVARPGIYKPEVNRELGNIMFKSGRDDLKKIVTELEQFQKAKKLPLKTTPSASVHAMPEQEQKSLLRQRGAIEMGGGPPRRRKDVLKDLRTSGAAEQFPVEQSVRMPARQSDANALPQKRSGIMDSPLPMLAAAGLGGTAVVAGLEHLMPPEASTDTQTLPQRSDFMSSIVENAQRALNTDEARVDAGLPRTPSLKPNLLPVKKVVTETANKQARTAESKRRQEYYDWLKRTPGAGTIWTNVHEQRADELRVTPDDRARGVIARRLQYGFEIPIEALESAPVEELIEGEWRALVSSP